MKERIERERSRRVQQEHLERIHGKMGPDPNEELNKEQAEALARGLAPQKPGHKHRALTGWKADPKTPPNAPCPCKSGKKFKKCHGRMKAAVANPEPTLKTDGVSDKLMEASQSILPKSTDEEVKEFTEGLEMDVEIVAASPTAKPLLDAFNPIIPDKNIPEIKEGETLEVETKIPIKKASAAVGILGLAVSMGFDPLETPERKPFTPPKGK